MAKRMNIAISLVLCACALPMAANCAESVSNATQTARQLFSTVKKAARTTANKMTGLGEVAPRVPYRSALAVDAVTGKVRYQDNADVKAHPASCTKMMTLLLVLEDLRAGNPPGVFICHNDGLAAGEILIEQCGHAPEYALAKFEGLGVGCHLQGRCYSFFGSHWIAVLIYKYNLFSAIRDYAGGMAFAFVESG